MGQPMIHQRYWKNIVILIQELLLCIRETGGLVSATITGIESACGDFIAFVDPDDTVGYDYLSTLIAAMDNGVDVVSAGYFYSEGQVLTAFPLRNQTTYQDEKLDFFAQILYYFS
ncbi:glycosyltransferase [Bifidobacterium longum]|uniref:glycosyltransferase n=1 Tax=Bifidobacterium longum TaxID=216816 RepID=UPI001249A5D7